MATQPVWITLHVQLEPLQLNPPIWRLLRVSGDCTLRKMHHFIQADMGWSSSHLHEFMVGELRYLPPDPEFPDLSGRDDRKQKIRSLLKTGDRVRYTYDFGDNWQHVISVQSIEPADVSGSWCEVIDGSRACPPEDVGSVPGYQHFLEAISSQPLTEDGRYALEWAGGSFDAELFDRRAANAAVQRICNNFWG